MEAQGKSEEALAAKRADELAALDETLRALQEQVWAAQDAAEAAKALAQAQEEAARQAEAIASKRRDLEIQLMEATGNAAGALAARRADELAALDPELRRCRSRSGPPRTPRRPTRASPMFSRRRPRSPAPGASSRSG
jgi:hypothetical protein